MKDTFILKGKVPVPCEGPLKWARWFESANRQVAETKVGDVKISTVFLGLNHSFYPNAKPILFETMVFGGELDGEQERYCTWDEAEAGHEEMVRRVKGQQ